jgi:isopenicillin-N epimerase
MIKPTYDPFIQYWSHDRDIVFLNHGSFGAVPQYVVSRQRKLQDRWNEDPIRFLVREQEPLWWENKKMLAEFLHTKSSNIALIKNATQGINTILNNIDFEPGEEILSTNHIYGACLHNIQVLSKKKNIDIKLVEVPFPIQHEDQVTEAIISGISSKTKVVLIDHITSATGLIFPVKKIIEALKNTGIITVVDGAHAPGMVALDLEELRPHYYTGNCHKWMYTPNGSAFIYVREDCQEGFLPGYISHVHDSPLENEEERWAAQFFWQGTDDTTAQLCIKDAFYFVEHILELSWEEMRMRNRKLMLEARALIHEKLGLTPSAPEHMLGFLCTFPFIAAPEKPAYGFNYFSPIGKKLFDQYAIEIPVMRLPTNPPKWHFRISPQVYNHLSQYDYLAEALKQIAAQ